jgi:hypothetical protein
MLQTQKIAVKVRIYGEIAASEYWVQGSPLPKEV